MFVAEGRKMRIIAGLSLVIMVGGCGPTRQVNLEEATNIGRPYYKCIWNKLKGMDDRISDALTVARAAEPACRELFAPFWYSVGGTNASLVESSIRTATQEVLFLRAKR